nr:PREDICTED: arf-GAP with Rho-GAP domain, ANK repeat and PH domain-containing protein 1 [Latimeria chalumnae]|eukprot:XP_014347562.1 PREDICTED: arf-GAP with Rho-GAP domain, ANK repeat and PH domain-containing protein 1 [Latimeria chalumnae]
MVPPPIPPRVGCRPPVKFSPIAPVHPEPRPSLLTLSLENMQPSFPGHSPPSEQIGSCENEGHSTHLELLHGPVDPVLPPLPAKRHTPDAKMPRLPPPLPKRPPVAPPRTIAPKAAARRSPTPEPNAQIYEDLLDDVPPVIIPRTQLACQPCCVPELPPKPISYFSDYRFPSLSQSKYEGTADDTVFVEGMTDKEEMKVGSGGHSARYHSLPNEDRKFDDGLDDFGHNGESGLMSVRPSMFSSTGSISMCGKAEFEDETPQLSPVIKDGWLDKNPPQGSYIYQKRWVKLDSDYLRYFDSEKDMYSKRFITLSSISRVAYIGDQKFEVITHNRNFLFRADSDTDRNEWVRTLQHVMEDRRSRASSRLSASPLQGSSSDCVDKCGYLELKGCKPKLYVVVMGDKVLLYKNHEDFRLGIGITFIEMNLGNVKDVDKKAFDLTTPYRTFNFLADSDCEKDEWVEAMQQSIAEALSNSEVAKLIWEEESNTLCADCGAPKPDWASINLCVVICKRCAEVEFSHPQLFQQIGNARANTFWAANVPPSEAINVTSGTGERQRFILAKYKEGKYRRYHPLFGNTDELNKVSYVGFHRRLFVFYRCCHPLFGNTDELNKVSYVGFRRGLFVFYRCCHLLFGNTDELNKVSYVGFRRGLFVFYRCCYPLFGNMDELNKFPFRFECTFEIYTDSERLYLFGSDSAETVKEWVKSIAKSFLPPSAEDLLNHDFERIGRLPYKDGLSLESTKAGWFALAKSTLYACFEESGKEEEIHLKKLLELSVQTDNDVLVLVERGRTLFVHGEKKLYFSGWISGIQRASGSSGHMLSEQQLTEADVPVIVDRCIDYITQCGLTSEGIYRKSGQNSKTTNLLETFRKDARRVKLKEGDHHVDDVSNTLKRFFRDIKEGIFTSEAYRDWLNTTTGIEDEYQRILQYQQLLTNLPKVNKATLTTLINHLYCVQRFSEMNQMNTHNLAIVFGPTLFQTDGQDHKAGRVIEDLISHYVVIFSVDEQQLKKRLDEISAIIKLRIAGSSSGPQVGRTVPASMTAEELTFDILDRRKVVTRDKDYWCCFEVNMREEMERLLHFSEKVLPIFHSLGSDSYLVVKRHLSMEPMLIYLASKVEDTKHGMMKYREDRSLLGRNTGSFHDRYFILNSTSLRLYKEVRSHRPEKEWPVKSLRIYWGIKKRLRPPTCSDIEGREDTSYSTPLMMSWDSKMSLKNSESSGQF